jgi:outer membrane biosynthesis protein TonB
MPLYSITSNAGNFVAGRNNPGAGTVLMLTEKQAAYEVLLGSLVPHEPAVDAPPPSPPAPEQVAAEKPEPQQEPSPEPQQEPAVDAPDEEPLGETDPEAPPAA